LIFAGFPSVGVHSDFGQYRIQYFLDVNSEMVLPHRSVVKVQIGECCFIEEDSEVVHEEEESKYGRKQSSDVRHYV
jgi:hypothetical protein